MENQELMKSLGVLPSTRMTTITIDNGDDKNGTNATGEFVVKTKNGETMERKKYGTEIKGIILKVRARIASKYKEGATGWYSTEFNSIDPDEAITLRQGKDILGTYNYQQIKAQQSFKNPDGTVTNNFTYSTLLYVQLETNEIVKIKLTGKSQGNWFKFNQTVGATTLSFICNFKIVKQEDNDSFECTFAKGEKVDINESIQIAKTLADPKQLIGQAAANPQISTPEPVQAETPMQVEFPTPVAVPQEQVGIPELTEENIPDDIEEIKTEDIPF